MRSRESFPTEIRVIPANREFNAGDGFDRSEDPRNRATVRPPCDRDATHLQCLAAASWLRLRPPTETVRTMRLLA
jgi:hypothetical protein